MSLSDSRGLPLGVQCRLYSLGARSVMLYVSEAWPVKDTDVIRLERKDARMIQWTCNVRPEDRISTDETTHTTRPS